MKSANVREVMGEYALTFYQVNKTAKTYRYLNDRSKKMNKMFKQWTHILPQLPDGVNYFCLVTKTVPSKSKSGSSYQILGVLSCYDFYDDTEEVSKHYRTKHKYLETDAEKLAWTKQFAQAMQEWHTERDVGDFAVSTLKQLMEIA